MVMRAAPEPSDPPSPLAGGEQPAGFRLVRISDLEELEAGAYWPRLQPHFRKPDFRRLRYRIEERAGRDVAPEASLSVRGASGLGEFDVAYIADRLAATLRIAEAGVPDYCLTAVMRGALDYAAGTRATLGVDARVGLMYRGVPGTTCPPLDSTSGSRSGFLPRA